MLENLGPPVLLKSDKFLRRRTKEQEWERDGYRESQNDRRRKRHKQYQKELGKKDITKEKLEVGASEGEGEDEAR